MIHLDFWLTMLSYGSSPWTNLVNPKGVLCECLSASSALSHGPVSAEVSILSCSESSSDIFELLCFVLDICKRPLLQTKSKVFSNGWLLKDGAWESSTQLVIGFVKCNILICKVVKYSKTQIIQAIIVTNQ